MSFIEMRNIRKDFGKLTILHGVDLDLDKGQVISIIGPSGAGKSTLLRCLIHLESIQGGSIKVDGDYLAEEKNGQVVYAPENKAKEILAKMGMVFQSFNLFPHMTVLDNVMVAPIYVKGMKKEEILPIAEDLLNKVGLLNKKDVYPGSLSGGQKQRVAIARAMVNEPALILADEPTGALDSQTSRIVMDLFHEMHEKYHKTIVLITHNPQLAEECQRVLTLRDGLIVGERKGSGERAAL